MPRVILRGVVTDDIIQRTRLRLGHTLAFYQVSATPISVTVRWDDEIPNPDTSYLVEDLHSIFASVNIPAKEVIAARTA